jgi:hypothetical protein
VGSLQKVCKTGELISGSFLWGWKLPSNFEQSEKLPIDPKNSWQVLAFDRLA